MGEESPNRRSTPAGAVFLSYASEDTDAAERICTSVRAAGIEVWFDQSELRGGDAWDRSIRKQIHDCALFIPLISQHSQERLEGYFRLEWKLAVDRSHRMAAERSFIVPVVVDSTRERDALVPESFRDVQWTHLPGGEVSPVFIARIATLLGSPAPVATATGPSPTPVTARPAGKRNRRAWLPLGLAGLAIVVGGGWFAVQHSGLHRHAQTAAAGQSQPAITEKSIAVLPFADLSERHDQEYFADGMAEEVLDLLANVPGLRVISRTSSFQFKGKNPDLRTVGSTLGVNYIVEGSVRRSGERFRVTAQLIDTQDGAHLWSESYDESVADALNLQQRIAFNLVHALQVTIGADYYPRPRASFKTLEAYDLYLRGRHALDRFDKEGFESAASYFQQVLDLDPNSVPALEWLGVAQELLAENSYVAPREGYERVRASAERALALDPGSSIAYDNLAAVELVYDWNWAAAERDVKRALQLKPREPFAIATLGQLCAALGRWDESADLLHTAINLDPLYGVYRFLLADVLYRTGRLGEAEAEMRKLLQLTSWGAGHYELGQILLAQGKSDDALAEMQQETDSQHWNGLAIVYYAMGRRAESDGAFAHVRQERAKIAPFEIAQIHAYRRELDESFTWLERAYDQRDAELYALKGDPLLKDLENDPRYRTFLHKMNLPE